MKQRKRIKSDQILTYTRSYSRKACVTIRSQAESRPEKQNAKQNFCWNVPMERIQQNVLMGQAQLQKRSAK
jgi:hypothetical protein